MAACVLLYADRLCARHCIWCLLLLCSRWLSDRYLEGRRLLLLSPLCCLAGISIALLHYSIQWGTAGEIHLVTQVALVLAGAAISAPDSVLGGAATADACGDEPDGSAADLAATASCMSSSHAFFRQALCLRLFQPSLSLLQPIPVFNNISPFLYMY